MQDDLIKWGNDPLADIARQMGEVKRRLEISQAGKITQQKQDEIVKELDKLIKGIEDGERKAKEEAEAKENAANQQAQGKGQKEPKQPSLDSHIMGGDGKGVIDERKLKKIAETWGTLPPKERAKVILELTQDLPTKFKPMIERYLEALTKR